VSETALGLLVHDGGVITPPSPILCAVRIGMRVETCAAAAFSIANQAEAWDHVGRRGGSSAGLAYFAPAQHARF
jgi:hypothetical protein